MSFDALTACVNRAVTSSAMLGVTVLYRYKSGAVDASLQGVWDDQTEALDADTGAAVMIQRPRFGVNIDDMQEPPQKGDRLERNDITYQVIDHRTSGYGLIELDLQRVTRG